MVLPGLLIEYLVVGSMATVWFLPIFGFELSDAMNFGKAAVIAPALYVLGMFVDFFAFILLSRIPNRTFSLKNFARWYVKKKPDVKCLSDNVFKDGYGRSSRGRIWLYLNAPEVVTEVQSRSSRDRIARGAVVNILILAILSNCYTEKLHQFAHIQSYIWGAILLFSLGVWLFLEANSYGFELRAGEMIQEALVSSEQDQSG